MSSFFDVVLNDFFFFFSWIWEEFCIQSRRQLKYRNASALLMNKQKISFAGLLIKISSVSTLFPCSRHIVRSSRMKQQQRGIRHWIEKPSSNSTSSASSRVQRNHTRKISSYIPVRAPFLLLLITIIIIIAPRVSLLCRRSTRDFVIYSNENVLDCKQLITKIL